MDQSAFVNCKNCNASQVTTDHHHGPLGYPRLESNLYHIPAHPPSRVIIARHIHNPA
jgi:hypothetical protein